MRNEIIRLENVITSDVTKTNLNNFNLHLFAGEILGLIAVDEHGKDKLLEILYQNSSIRFGRIYFKEMLVNSYKYSDNTFNKVYILSQKSKLIDHLNVLDNVFVLKRGFRKYVINSKVLAQQFYRLLEESEIDIEINPYDFGDQLTEYQRCVVEIIKAIVQGIKVIVINNISSELSEKDLKAFKLFLKRLVLNGYGIIYIGNHHEEVFSISDRVALMKSGSIIKVFEKDELFEQNILPYTISMDKAETSLNSSCGRGEILFRGITTEYLKDITFEVQKGTCVVLYDRSNKVQQDVISCLIGENKLNNGEIYFETEGVQKKIEKKSWKHQIAVIDENPIKNNMYYNLSFIDNFCTFLDNKKKTVYISGKLKASIQKEYYKELGEALYETDLNKLDKTDLYNLVYYRILLQNPKVVFIAQPFTDADMYLRFHIIKLIRMLKQKEIAVIILAFTISDNLHIADKFILIEEGYKKKEFLPEEFSEILLDI